ncbi:MAG: TonB-dependent receptor [Odoribacteraceae bacterium]|jgi:TonB-linked SusC/RagA family outer membrane protein|nr:TonB-dependent receptor [Odoribacteraceae bacterium]
MKTFGIITWIVCLLLPAVALAQTEAKVSGVVTDRNNETIPGVTIYLKSDQARGTVSRSDGAYEINAPAGSTLVFSFIGYKTREMPVGKGARQVINVELDDDVQMLEEVSVVGYGTQRKVSVIGSISTVKPEMLLSGSVSSVSNALSGRIAGLIGIQRSGEPGEDVSEFWIRGISTFGAGRNALVLIDGIDRGASSLNELAPEDIESFSILKDATATAVYGARGANGVILINTKRGQEGKISINANIKTMVETLPRLPEYLRAYDYARLANEASVVRGGGTVYSPATFDIIRYNMDPDLFPDVSWQEEILRKHTYGVQGNISISGGGKLAKYYMSGFYRTNDAIYKENGMERYHSNVRRDQYTFRSNIDVDVTSRTRVSLLLSAKLVDMNRPGLGTTTSIWNAQANITPLTVPVIYSNGQFPSYGAGNNTSPTVLLNQTGFITERTNSVESLLQIGQDLGMIAEGLKVTGSISFDNLNFHRTSRTKMPDLYMASDRNWNTGELITTRTVVAQPMKFASTSYGRRTIYAEAKLDYNVSFGDRHRASALFLYQQKDYQRTDVTDELLSIPERDQGIAGRLTYSYNDLYFIEGNFGYNGSENFPKGQRFGFFPSVALGWVVSNHEWVKQHLPFINNLKLRYSYGLVGNDEIENTRFPYLSTVDMSARGYVFGDTRQAGQTGISEDAIGSTGLVWEQAVKQNWGVDLQLWNSLNVVVDAFVDNRDNIFMKRASLPGTMGIGNKTVWGNVGKMKSWGADGTASYTRAFGDFNMELRGNFTFTRDKIIDYDEVPPRYPYMAHKGTSNDVTRGLIALGLFKDEADVRSSPAQFGEVLPGDIKYQDVNGDDRIDDDDIVPIGNSNIPKLQYGFAGSLSWRGVDFNIFFRGSSKVDYFMGGAGYYPFSGGRTGNVLSIVKQQKNRWTPVSYSGDPATENPNARFPRLTYGENLNNNRNSSFWLADASFLRLKTLEIGYTLPKHWAEKVAMTNFRVSLIGDNLHVWDKVKLWDPEQASSNGAVYPLTRSYSVVVQFSF